MRGFLSKWFNRKSEEKSLPRTYREEPVLSAKGKLHQNHLQTDELEHVAHPDTEFLDYEDWDSESIETQTTPNTTPHTEQLSAPEIVAPNDVIPDAEWPEEYPIDAPNTQELEINARTQVSDEGESIGTSEKLLTADHPNTSANNIQQETQPIIIPPGNQLEVVEIAQQVDDPTKTSIDTPNQVSQLKSKDKSACIKCGASLADFNTAIKLWFCPFCGAEQLDDEAKIANTESQSEYKGEDTGFSEKTSDDYQADSLEEVFIEEVTYASTKELHSTERVSEENKQTQRSKSIPISFSEEPFNGVDEGFDDEILDIDLQSYQPVTRGRNSSDENEQPLGDWNGARSENTQAEEWEIFLDEDLEEQSHPSDQYFEDEDPLEQGKIVEYASRLTSRITSYQSKDRRRIYAFFISILGDFPFYQSYAAIERLIAKDVQIDQIRDAYAVKLLWMTNPNIWSSRRYNRMENNWSVSRNPKLKNSMSWQLASDLVNSLTPNELENLILNDWYAEWLNLPLHGGDTASGLDPAYSLYPTYLYEKRRLLTANLNTW